MNSAERKAQIELYGRGCDLLAAQLAQTPKAMWQYKPSAKDWSVHEIIIHLADSESNSYLRCRKALAEPQGGIMGYDQDAWAIKLDYHARNTDDALALLRLVRKMTYDLIKTLPDEAWATSYFHPERQAQVPLDDWITGYAAHIPEHIEQIKNNVRLWEHSPQVAGTP
jgi:hypothetical protein